jgi:transposase
MKIIKFIEFIKEELNDTPESYVELALAQIKRKIDIMFDFQRDSDTEEPKPEPKNKSVNQAKKDSKEKSKMNLKDLGVRLESSEISKYSKLYDSLTVKFSDDDATYSLILMIDLKEALPKDATKDFSYEDIKKCYIKFKKYDLDTFEIIGQLTKNVEVKDINEDFLINLKIELDEKFGSEESELQFETE